jgi:uncharacterized membrane protein YidH (DUF202 family)
MSDDATSLAVSRTMLAHDRTLMAWVRTATSMISFGFTIYKFFQFLEDQKSLPDVDRLLDYRQQMAFLHQRYPSADPYHSSVTLVVATMISGLGVLGFVVVMLRQ